jgi:hypothetical protein
MSLSKVFSENLPKYEKKARSHEDLRHIVCASCHEKKLGCIRVTETTEKQIKSMIYEGQFLDQGDNVKDNITYQQ